LGLWGGAVRCAQRCCREFSRQASAWSAKLEGKSGGCNALSLQAPCAQTRCAKAMRARQNVIPIEWEHFEEIVGFKPPIFKVPEVDIKGRNEIVEVSFGLCGKGVEVTVVFRDEDRPRQCEDLAYDCIRLPLFGRSEDIETFTVIRDERGVFTDLHFAGTWSGDQTWQTAMPTHLTETVPLEDFETEGGRPVVWVNVWNHLFGARNTNSSMPSRAVERYKCTSGTRDDVDQRYVGILTRVA